jgi:3-isopropylmalate/(R)-2-methylmalate dehydratase large subunit
VQALSVEERMTLCNLSIESGAKIGLIAPDEKTIDCMRGREFTPKGALFDQAAKHWRSLAGDVDAILDAEQVIDAAAIEPMITWGTSPEQTAPVSGRIPDPASCDDPARRRTWAAALDYMGLEAGTLLAGTRIDRRCRTTPVLRVGALTLFLAIVIQLCALSNAFVKPA